MTIASSSVTRIRTRDRHARLREWERRMLGPDSALRERWQRLLDHPRAELLLGAGLLGALAVVAVPPRGWARIGGGLFAASAWLARAPVGAVVIGVVLAKVWSDPDGSDAATRASARKA